jgi:Helix-turn-helix domain
MTAYYSENQTAFDFLDAQTRGIWRVWRDSYKKHLLVPLPRKTLRQYFRELQKFNMMTRGAIGGSAMRVAYELIEHFADEMTGELTPSKQQIATRLGLCVRTVANALDRLKAYGILDWVRRCVDDQDERGRYQLKQISNAYSIKSPASWRGYKAAKVPLQPKAELVTTATTEAPQPRRSPIWSQTAPSWDAITSRYQENPSFLARLLRGN